MFSNFKRRVLAGALLLTACAGTFVASAQDYLRSFTLVNQSSFTIRRLYVAPTSFSYWGPDRLGSNVLRPDYKITLNLEPGYYDIKLVDEDGDSCVVSNVDFRQSDTIYLNNTNLLACELLH
jgi:hypothetical protein